jgi:hypothetical protein
MCIADVEDVDVAGTTEDVEIIEVLPRWSFLLH